MNVQIPMFEWHCWIIFISVHDIKKQIVILVENYIFKNYVAINMAIIWGLRKKKWQIWALQNYMWKQLAKDGLKLKVRIFVFGGLMCPL
jgi:hypothetical protein